MDTIPDATEQDVRIMPDLLFTLSKWAVDKGKKESTVRAYCRKLAILFAADGKAAAAMASPEYLAACKASPRAKTDHGTCGGGSARRSSATWGSGGGPTLARLPIPGGGGGAVGSFARQASGRSCRATGSAGGG